MTNHLILNTTSPRDLEKVTQVIAGLQREGLKFEAIFRDDGTVDIRVQGY